MSCEITIGKRVVGSENPALIVAEIGTGHDGDLSHGLELIAAAAEAGADCAKFQLVFADEIIHPNTGDVPLPGGSVPLYDRFRGLEQALDFYRQLKEATEAKGLIFLCTPFGKKSAEMLHALDVAAYKIASPELNHYPLIEQIAGYGKPIILSCGVSTLAEIERAVTITGRNSALLHCVTAYPAPEEDYNLRLLPSFKSLFGVPVGVSDHSLHPTLVPSLSAAFGASIIEKHFTLSRSGTGLDDPIALSPTDFRSMADAVRGVERAGPEATLRAARLKNGDERIDEILGSGVKELAPSERMNYGRTNRSIHALVMLAAGTVLTSENVALLRSEKVLRPGLPPEMLPRILGKRIVREVLAGEGIVWDDLFTPGA